MNKFLIAAALAAAFSCSAALAQSAPQTTDPAVPQAQPPAPQTTPQSQQAPTANPPAGAAQSAAASAGTPKIAPGSVIPVQLTKTVDAKKAKTGDEVVAKVTMDMKNQGGEVLVPKDTKVIGHVTEAQARSKDQKESQLAIAFDRAQIKNGGEVPMPMSIQAVIGQQNNQNAGGGEPEAPGGGGSPGAGNARGASGGGQSSTPPAASASSASSGGGEGQGGAAAPRPPINEKTTGVIGISNLNLAAPQNTAQGSVMTSDKNNVKLESGTMLLLKVSQ